MGVFYVPETALDVRHSTVKKAEVNFGLREITFVKAKKQIYKQINRYEKYQVAMGTIKKIKIV